LIFRCRYAITPIDGRRHAMPLMRCPLILLRQMLLLCCRHYYFIHARMPRPPRSRFTALAAITMLRCLPYYAC